MPKTVDSDASLTAERPSRNVFLRAAHNYDPDQVTVETGLQCADPSLALQSQAEEANINTIVRNFGVTGMLPQTLTAPTYGDFTGISDYHEAMGLIVEANAAFAALPSDLRRDFNHDPGAFLDYVESANADQLAELGIERVDARQLHYKQPKTPAPVSAPAPGALVPGQKE